MYEPDQQLRQRTGLQALGLVAILTGALALVLMIAGKQSSPSKPAVAKSRPTAPLVADARVAKRPATKVEKADLVVRRDKLGDVLPDPAHRADAILPPPPLPPGTNLRAFVEKHIRTYIDDPDGLEFVAWGGPKTIVPRVPDAGTDPAEAVRVMFRARNARGAKVMHDYVFLFRNGQPVRSLETKTFDVFQSAPTVDQVLGAFRFAADQLDQQTPP